MAYVPKCPKCGSNDVRKISFVEGFLHFEVLGFLSKTALSDYVCRECGYKW